MLIFTSSDLTTASVGTGGTLTTTPNSSTIGGSLIASISLTATESDIITSTTIPAYSGNTIAISIPTEGGLLIDNVSSVSVGGQSYTLFTGTPEEIGAVTSSVTVGDTTTETTSTGTTIATTTTNGTTSVTITPPPGTYTYSSSTQILTLSATATPPTEGAPITYVATKRQGITRSDDYAITLPQLLRKWNVLGEIQLSRSFESSPSGSFSFSATESDRDEICSDFKTGTPIVLLGHGYSVSNLEIVGVMDSLETVGRIEVSVSLRGIHDDGLDNVVKLRTSKNTTKTSLSALATRAGLTYSGPSVTINVDKEAPLRTGTTVSSEMSGRARVAGGFAYYSDPNEIQIREWGKTTVHRLGVRDLVSGASDPITVQYGGGKVKIDGVYISVPYENTELNIEQDSSSSGNGRTNEITIIKGGSLANDSIIVNGNLPRVTMESGADCFDNGGVTSNLIFTKYVNGTEVSREERIYGYAYATSDSMYVYTANETIDGETVTRYEPGLKRIYKNGTGQSFHAQVVREEKSESIFDSDGYLVARNNTITGLTRYRQESGQEAIEAEINRQHYDNDQMTALEISNVKAYYLALRNLYSTFFSSTVIETETFSLSNLRSRYPDIPEPSDDDPEPRYCRKRTRSRLSRFESTDLYQKIKRREKAAVGLNNADLDPLMFVGDRLEETEETTIVYPPAGTSNDRYQEGKDTFTIGRKLLTAQGERLKNVAKDDIEETNTGRPNPHQRLQYFDESNDPTPDDAETDTNTYILRTPGTGLTNSDPSNGSVSFPGGNTLSKALAAARLDIAIRNTQDSEVWTVKVLTDRLYSEGDRIILSGYSFVVLSVSESLQIQKTGKIKAPFWTLTMGRMIAPTVELGTIREDS